MFITVKPHGRTGNRLFQYALGLILAKEKQWNFFAPSLPYFNNLKIISDSNPSLTENNTLFTSTYGTHYYDFNELLTTTKNICIDSFVQKAELLVKYKHFLQEQFYFNLDNNILPASNELVIHIRETDYTILNAYLGNEFYIDFIKNNKNNYSKITIVTDNINAPLIHELKNIGCEIFTQTLCTDWQNPLFTYNEINDFNYMLNCNNLLLSQSTFSWWAAFLGSSKKIIFPYKANGGMWKLNPEKDDTDLYFDFGFSEKHIIQQ